MKVFPFAAYLYMVIDWGGKLQDVILSCYFLQVRRSHCQEPTFLVRLLDGADKDLSQLLTLCKRLLKALQHDTALCQMPAGASCNLCNH